MKIRLRTDDYTIIEQISQDPNKTYELYKMPADFDKNYYKKVDNPKSLEDIIPLEKVLENVDKLVSNGYSHRGISKSEYLTRKDCIGILVHLGLVNSLDTGSSYSYRAYLKMRGLKHVFLAVVEVLEKKNDSYFPPEKIVHNFNSVSCKRIMTYFDKIGLAEFGKGIDANYHFSTKGLFDLVCYLYFNRELWDVESVCERYDRYMELG